jgi:hypothetical protein
VTLPGARRGDGLRWTGLSARGATAISRPLSGSAPYPALNAVRVLNGLQRLRLALRADGK